MPNTAVTICSRKMSAAHKGSSILKASDLFVLWRGSLLHRNKCFPWSELWAVNVWAVYGRPCILCLKTVFNRCLQDLLMWPWLLEHKQTDTLNTDLSFRKSQHDWMCSKQAMFSWQSIFSLSVVSVKRLINFLIFHVLKFINLLKVQHVRIKVKYPSILIV